MEAIILGNPYSPELGSTTPIEIPAYTAEEAVVILADGYNPYLIGSTGSTDSYWFRYDTGILTPLTSSDRVVIGASSFVNTELFRVSGKANLTSLQLGSSTTISSILDEDDMVSNSNTAVPTQQSVKAYIDNQLATSGIQIGDNVSLLTNDSGYITSETDPIFVASDAYAVTSTGISHWNTAYGWGNHASAGYLTSETDPVFVASEAYTITSTDTAHWDTAYTNNHTHSNKTLLDSLTSAGGGTQALFNDGTYKTVLTTIAGSTNQVQYNISGALSASSSFTYTPGTTTLSAPNIIGTTSIFVSNTSTYLSKDGSNNLVLTDAVSGSVTLATLLGGATNYWTTISGGIYYTNYVGVNNPSSLDEALTVNGNIQATNFNSSYLRYTNSNLLLGPNAGDNETGDNFIYIHNTNTSSPIFKADMLNRNTWLNSNVYISNGLYLGADNTIGLAASLTYLSVTDPHIGTRTLYSFIDGSTNTLVADFDDLATVQAITSSNTSVWNKASYIITTGSGDSYLSNDGTYKVISNVGNTTTLYLHNDSSDISGYEKLLNSPNSGAEDIDVVAVTSGTSPVLIDDYATEPSYPGVTTIPAGLWTFKTWLSVDSATGSTTVTIRVYKRTTGGTETELFNVVTSEINALTVTRFDIETVQPEFTIDATDRIVIKYYTSTTSVSTINVSIYYEGTAHYSYVITPLSFATTLITDYTWKWDTTESYIRPYLTKTEAGGVASSGKFYLGTSDPSATNRLNYDGYLYATKLYSGAAEVITDISSKEDSLGNPASDGYILSSTTSGTRSWIAPVNPVDDILDWSTNKYIPYSTQQAFLSLDTSSSNPSLSTRLNVNGALWAKSFNVFAGSFSGTSSSTHVASFVNSASSDTTNAGCYINAYRQFGYGLAVSNGGITGSSAGTKPMIYVERNLTSGSVDYTSNIIEIVDNPSTSGTISGKVLTATIEATERISYNPRVADGASAVAYFEDTHNALTTNGAKIHSFRNQGTEICSIDKDGNIDIPTGSSYKINGTDILTTISFESDQNILVTQIFS